LTPVKAIREWGFKNVFEKGAKAYNFSSEIASAIFGRILLYTLGNFFIQIYWSL